MVDEQNASSQRGLKKKLLGLAMALVVPALAAGGVYYFVVRPMLTQEEARAGEESEDRISESAVTLSMEESFATVNMSNTNIPASLLLFKVSLECANPETAELVNSHKVRFVDMINGLHSFRKRETLNDASIKEEIQQEAIRRANAILERLPKPDNSNADYRITDVFHERFAIQDQI
ncbi:MAG: flagellar basal body-associated protein FliL [Candidatus Hydrogenedentota bacterium]